MANDEVAKSPSVSKPTPRQSETAPQPLPRWLKRNVPLGTANHFTSRLIGELGLQTVCDHAKCPNRMECYSQLTATFMILGKVCTRNCRFCSVEKGKPLPVDPDEPRRLAEAAKRLGLKHVVITCVTRDDLPDGGADHFFETVVAVRKAAGATVEVLPSDFSGNVAAVERVLEASPEVYNHNTETVPRLFREIRGPKANFRWMLDMFRHIRRHSPSVQTKTGLMLGLGETVEELLETLAELCDSGCRMLTLGQYLQPASKCVPVARFVPPEEFDRLGEMARRIGFEQVASGPFVRSSYHAARMVERHPE
jgi:lipoic acid synthetase